jgi:hypothetical protein
LELQNYAVIKPTENSCIKFHHNKLNNLQRYDTTQKYRILHKAVQCLYPNITSKFRTTTIFKTLVKENDDLSKTWRYINDPLLYQTSFVWVQQLMSKSKAVPLLPSRWLGERRHIHGKKNREIQHISFQHQWQCKNTNINNPWKHMNNTYIKHNCVHTCFALYLH